MDRARLAITEALEHVQVIDPHCHLRLDRPAADNLADLLAKHIPNISVAGYWWHTLYPHYVKKTIETRSVT